MVVAPGSGSSNGVGPKSWPRLGLIVGLGLVALLLSGCLQYDLGVTFRDANHGMMVQHIRLQETLTPLTKTIATRWLESQEQQAQKLGGSARSDGASGLVIQIPFYNAADLETKFNQFFQAAKSEAPSPSHLSIATRNFVLGQRHHLVYDLDLRSLQTLTTEGIQLVNLGELLDLDFRLETPWGLRTKAIDRPSTSPDSASPPHQEGRQWVWPLYPNRINHIEAVFWLPDPLGIGFVAIGVLVSLGMGLKAWMPGGVRPKSAEPTAAVAGDRSFPGRSEAEPPPPSTSLDT